MENAQQLAQLLAQGQGQQPSQNPMEWLKSFITPNSTAGSLSNQDAYSAYVLQAMERGENPLPRMEYLKQMQMGAENGL